MSDDIRKRIGEKLKSIRLKKGMTQQTLADEMNIQRTTIVKIEGGKFSITLDMLQRFADALNFKIELLSL